MLTNGYTVLLLEDEPLIALDMEQELGRAGFTVYTVMSCADARDWLEEHTPDVVIVDLKLRDGTPLDVVTRLVSASIPFIVHSGEHPSMHEDSLFILGAWIAKPAAPRDIIETAQALLVFRSQTGANIISPAAGKIEAHGASIPGIQAQPITHCTR